jgi:hypothetical protein
VGVCKLTNSLVSNNQTNSAAPENFVQSGTNVDIEITVRLTRAMWKAFAESDDVLRTRLNRFLQEEIDSVTLQHEIDRNGDDESGLAVAHLLEGYRQQ